MKTYSVEKDGPPPVGVVVRFSDKYYRWGGKTFGWRQDSEDGKRMIFSAGPTHYQYLTEADEAEHERRAVAHKLKAGKESADGSRTNFRGNHDRTD